MKLAKLARAPDLVPKGLGREERKMRGAFIKIRVLNIRVGLPKPNHIPDEEVADLKAQLVEEIKQAEVAYKAIRDRVDSDSAANDAKRLFLLANIDQRMKNYYLYWGTPKSIRKGVVKSIVWWATAVHPELLTLARLDDLHLLVDRRLRITERMLYDVGVVEEHDIDWNDEDILPDPTVPWFDDWARMFEYPYLPRDVFFGVCDPDADRNCQRDGMKEWKALNSGTLKLRKRIRLNPVVAPLWDENPDDDYEFLFRSGGDPVQAIEQLFIPAINFKDRNLLFCDHVIHALHMEALLWAKKKRSSDVSWLTSYIGTSPERLRIAVPLWRGVEFLAGHHDGNYFEFKRIQISNVQVGDHLIIYNHPVYDAVTVGGAWRFENAILVQRYPKPRFQGHGIKPGTVAEMTQRAVRALNPLLDGLREQVEDHLQSGNSSTEIDFGGDGILVQRVEPSESKYVATERKADWWLRWEANPKIDEPAIASSPERRARAKKTQKIEYVITDDNGNEIIYGYFPLWEPKKSKGKPRTNVAGKFKKAIPVKVGPKMLAAWTFFMPPPPHFLFNLSLSFRADLDAPYPSDGLIEQFNLHNAQLEDIDPIEQIRKDSTGKGTVWRIASGEIGYSIRLKNGKLRVSWENILNMIPVLRPIV